MDLHRTIWIFCFIFIFSVSIFATEAPSPPVYEVRMEQAWIPMTDGVRLAATLYMPDGAKPDEKFPALLEYLPYRSACASTFVDLVPVRALRPSVNIPSRSNRMASR
jgi:predicted acyl esterase